MSCQIEVDPVKSFKRAIFRLAMKKMTADCDIISVQYEKYAVRLPPGVEMVEDRLGNFGGDRGACA